MIIAPSMLSANFGNLDHDIEMINRSDADWFHLDVMDGVFVPNISFGFPVIESIAKKATKPLDIHLMIVQPERYIERIAEAGATIMNVHQEACNHLHRTVEDIKKHDMKAAVTLNPATPVQMLNDIISDLDMVLLMSVNPGFGGQKFIEHTYVKIRELKELIIKTNSSALIEVDGGVNLENAPMLAQAGADVLVAGNTIFNNDNPLKVISSLNNIR